MPWCLWGNDRHKRSENVKKAFHLKTSAQQKTHVGSGAHHESCHVLVALHFGLKWSILIKITPNIQKIWRHSSLLYPFFIPAHICWNNLDSKLCHWHVLIIIGTPILLINPPTCAHNLLPWSTPSSNFAFDHLYFRPRKYPITVSFMCASLCFVFLVRLSSSSQVFLVLLKRNRSPLGLLLHLWLWSVSQPVS